MLLPKKYSENKRICQNNELKKIDHKTYREGSPIDQIKNNRSNKINDDNALLLNGTEYNTNP